MRLRCPTIAITIFALFLAHAAPVSGQDKKKKSDDHSFDVKKFLKRLDENDNGMVEPSEIDRDRTRSFLKNAGADISKPINIKSFTNKLKEKKQSKRDAGSAQMSLGFSVADDEREESAGDSPGFAVLDEEKETFEKARAREFSESSKSMLEWVLRKYDRDGDGKLDAGEIKSGRWADPPADESDTNNDGALSRMELLVRYQDREDRKNGDGSRKSENRDRDGGDRYDRDRDGRGGSSGGSSSNRNSSSTGGRDVRKGYESYVNGIFKSYDKNSDQFLDEEEMEKMRRKPDKSVDVDKDSKISKSELLESYLSKATKNNSSDKSSAAKTRSSRSSSGKRDSSSKVTARAVTSNSSGAGKPLTSKDKDKNGQIEMSEFESNWTLEKIEEFYEKDKNRDGVITPSEWQSN